MKKLIVICMLAAIGAVAMIQKSNAQAFGGCNMPHGCVNDVNPPHVMRNRNWQHNVGQPNLGQVQGNNNHHWQGNNGNTNQGNYEWWKHRGHRGGNWNGGNPVIGLGIYGSPYYGGGSYYDDQYGYGDEPYYAPDYGYRVRPYTTVNRCNAWAQRLRSVGYRNVRSVDCAGTSYVYRATKAGRPVKVTVGARSGSIIRVARAY